jgi:hypothetical protein
LLIIVAYKMSLFSKGIHGRNNRGRCNWNIGPIRPIFSIHFDGDPKELNHIFQDGFFNWIGKGIVQPRQERPPFHPQNVPGIPVPPHVSLQPEFPENDECQEIFHPVFSHHHGRPNLSLPPPPHVNQNVQISPAHSLVQSSHARNRFKIEAHHVHDKVKDHVSPSSPSSDSSMSVSSHMYLRDKFSHVISDIKPQDSTQPKAISGKSKGDNSAKGIIASQSRKYGF